MTSYDVASVLLFWALLDGHVVVALPGRFGELGGGGDGGEGGGGGDDGDYGEEGDGGG